jgi:hypothetical protein
LVCSAIVIHTEMPYPAVPAIIAVNGKSLEKGEEARVERKGGKVQKVVNMP